jgi:hypothetical protein
MHNEDRSGGAGTLMARMAARREREESMKPPVRVPFLSRWSPSMVTQFRSLSRLTSVATSRSLQTIVLPNTFWEEKACSRQCHDLHDS